MARFILIDNQSGAVAGDQAVFAPFSTADAIQVCRRLDADNYVFGYGYEHVSELAAEDVGYRVYRAWTDGASPVPPILDRTDAAAVALVERHGELAATVRRIACHTGNVRENSANGDSDPVGGVF